MFLLSFPLGTSVVFLFHADNLGVFGRVAFWTLALGLGYAHWFHLFPALLRRARALRPVTLNLSIRAGVVSRSALGSAVTQPLALPDAAARTPVPHFKDRGMTPLERVFRDEE